MYKYKVDVCFLFVFILLYMVYYPPTQKFDIREIISQQDEKPSSFEPVQKKKKNKSTFKKALFMLATFIFVIVLAGGYLVYKTNSVFDQVTGERNSVFESLVRMLPFGSNFFQILPVEGEDNSTLENLKNNKLERLNILLLGIRGVDDPNGGLLTDTMMIMSIKPKTGEVALISIPRDLYVDMPYNNQKSKINEAYEMGMKNKDWKNGLKYSQKAVEDVTGLAMHYSVSVDFEAFREIIDILGGITITLDKPFSEKNQFEEGIIELPAGKQTIDGDTALLFVRARFSTSDFDRAERQQQVLLAIKEKAFGLGILSNPVKIISILNSIGNHMRTNAELWEIQEIAVLAQKAKTDNIKTKVFNTGKDGFLYASRDLNGSYILLPEENNFDKIHKVCEDIFNF